MYRFSSIKTRKSEVVNEDDQTVSIVLKAKDFIFNQCSIISSVMLEPNSYFITPQTSKFVNTNGDCWSNPSITSNYKSFIGAFNYINHVQEPSKAVGFIPDSVLRKIILNQAKNLFIYYVDILVATHRDNAELAKKILSGAIEFLSMGCDATISQCSKCGQFFHDDMLCDDLTFNKGKYFIDNFGVKRRIAEILGTAEPGTVDFIEASWLSQVPAFAGAAKRNTLSIPENMDVEIVMPKEALGKEAVTLFVKA